MSTTCLDTFSQLATATDKANNAKTITETHANCACEEISVVQDPAFPGIVESSETLIRAIWSPHHIEEDTGIISPHAFDDAARFGMSVIRKEHTNKEGLNALIEQQKADKLKTGKKHVFKGFATFPCQSIRKQELSEGNRWFCVYNTALAENPAHADVYQNIQGTKPDQKLARNSLLQMSLHGEKPIGSDAIGW